VGLPGDRVFYENGNLFINDKLIEKQVPQELMSEFSWLRDEHFPGDGPGARAVITLADEPSPETGHVGWCWWAMGSMGDAPSYEAARAAAEAEIQRRMDDRVAVL
jgi:hypothetical protein